MSLEVWTRRGAPVSRRRPTVSKPYSRQRNMAAKWTPALLRWLALQALPISNPRRERGLFMVHGFTAGMCGWENSVGYQEEVPVLIKNIRCQIWQHQQEHCHHFWRGLSATTLWELHWQEMDYTVPQPASSRQREVRLWEKTRGAALDTLNMVVGVRKGWFGSMSYAPLLWRTGIVAMQWMQRNGWC